MIDALSPLFAGPMVAYRDLITTYAQVQTGDEASLQRVVPARDVLSPGWLAACIAAHGQRVAPITWHSWNAWIARWGG